MDPRQLDARWSKPLEQHGVRVTVKTLQGRRSGAAPPAHQTFEGTDSAGAPLAVHVYDTARLPADDVVAEQLLTLSSLCHPHMLCLRQLIPTPDHLCVVTDGVRGGGDMFSLARRAGPHGLQPAAARFLFQQILATAQFLQPQGIHIHEVSPSSFLVDWNERGLPIVKLALLRLHRELQGGPPAAGAQRKVMATMLTCPQEIRREALLSGRYACARDVWAAAVVLFFLLSGRWPFSQQQMRRWADGSERFNPDAVDYRGVHRDAVPLMREVFSKGGLPAAQFAAQCPSVAEVLAQPWVAQDMPDGAADMAAKFTHKTQKRQRSPEFQQLQRGLEAALGCAPGAAPLCAPLGVAGNAHGAMHGAAPSAPPHPHPWGVPAGARAVPPHHPEAYPMQGRPAREVQAPRPTV